MEVASSIACSDKVTNLRILAATINVVSPDTRVGHPSPSASSVRSPSVLDDARCVPLPTIP